MSIPLRTEIKPENVEFKSRREKQTLFFDLWNRGEQVQMYKIKSTNAKEFNIKPVFFSIELNEKKRITVTYLGKSKAMTKDRITVVYGHQLNQSTTVQQAWEDQRHLANISCVEKRKYVKISFKDDPVKRPDEAAQKSAMGSVMQNSATIVPLAPSQSGINRDHDSYFAVPPGGPARVGQAAKKKSGSARMEVKETTEDEAAAGNKKTSSSKTKKSVDTTRTEEATVEEGQQPPPPPAKPKTRRKVTNPPPPPPPAAAEEEEETPAPPPPPKPVASKPKKMARSTAPTEAPASDEMADAPRAPSKKKSAPPKETEEDEEGEEAPPPPPIKTKKAGSRRKVQQPQPKESEDEEEEEAPPPPPVKPVTPARSKTGTRRKVMTVTPVVKRPPAPMAANDEDEATELDLKQKAPPVAPAAKPARTKPSPNSTPSKPKTKRKVSGTTRTLDEIRGSLPEGSLIYVISNDRQEEDEEEEEKKTKKKSKDNKKSGKKKKEESEEEEKEEEKE